jgi:ankyrin repeat protein
VFISLADILVHSPRLGKLDPFATFDPLPADRPSTIHPPMQRNPSRLNRRKPLEFPRSFALALFYLLLAIAALAAEPATITPDYLEALRRNDVHRLRQLLDLGADVNARDARGNSPLMLAGAYAGPDTMRLLLDRGAEVNATNAAGATALMRAASDDLKLRLLLEHGANVNARSAFGNTPLILAARPATSHRAVRLLLAQGADARATNIFGANALMAAAAGGDAQSVKLLLEHGVDPNAQPAPDENGFLFGGGRSPLMWAAFRGDTTAMNLLIDAGANVNALSGLGTPLAQAAWSDQIAAARLLIDRGALPNITSPKDGYAPLHWAASSEQETTALVRLLLEHGADANLAGGENVDAFMGTVQTPLMLARRRGDTAIVQALRHGGATNERPDRTRTVAPPARQIPDQLGDDLLRDAINQALGPLHATSIKSKQTFVSHSTKQDCTSCHQQHLPMTAIGLARKFRAQIDSDAEQALVAIVRDGAIKEPEVDWQPLFHPDPVQTLGYELFAYAGQDLPPDANTDAWVHHLSVVQGPDGRWFNNLPRPPIQTGDIGATALAIHALQRYPLPGRKDQLAHQVDHARRWLWTAKAQDTDSRIYKILGLAWAGEPAENLRPLAQSLMAEQRADGGWAQLPKLQSDAYATGQAIYALRVAAGLKSSEPSIDRGLRYLLTTQLADGTWHVTRRAFPFQPTMDSGFPHGRDGWISAAATSWAVMALSLPDNDRLMTVTPAIQSVARGG